jgi:uncharacterized membrane protein (DUF2068 family)
MASRTVRCGAAHADAAAMAAKARDRTTTRFKLFIDTNYKPLAVWFDKLARKINHEVQMNFSHSVVLRTVAVFKLLKAAMLIITGIGILKLMHNDVASTLQHWVARLGLDPGRRFVSEAIERATALPHERIRDLGIVSFIYAGLFITEGVGLWMLKRWAEWFTVIITSSLVPVEAYEIVQRTTLIRIVVLLINIAVVVYLLRRIVKDRPEGAHA